MAKAIADRFSALTAPISESLATTNTLKNGVVPATNVMKESMKSINVSSNLAESVARSLRPIDLAESAIAASGAIERHFSNQQLFY